jgi:cystine transport system substrate-binding protein
MTMQTARRTILRSLALALCAGAAARPAFAAEGLLAQVRQRGLVVGLEGTYRPFSFQDKDGRLAGFEVEFAQALAARLGVKLRLQPTRWDGMLGALASKRLDVVINQVAISDERRKTYDFSAPYTVSGIQALTKKALAAGIAKPADLAGKKVGVGLGSNYEGWLRANVPGAVVKTYDDDPSKYQDLRNGRTDVVLVDRFAALTLIQQTGDTLALAGPPFSRVEAAVVLRKGNEDLREAIDKAVVALRSDGTLARISQTWFGRDVTR